MKILHASVSKKFYSILLALISSGQLVHGYTQTVPEYQVTHYAREEANNFLREQKLNPSAIPTNLQAEYDQKIDKAAQNILAVMRNDGRTRTDTEEIRKEIRYTLKHFVEKLKTKDSSSSSSTWDSWWDSFFGTTNTPTTTNTSSYTPSTASSSTSNTQIKRSQLDSKALEIANQVLRTKGINPQEIPARAVSDFNNMLRQVVQRMKDHMNYTYQDYVTPRDIEQAVNAEIQPIIDKIFLRGEMCVICQDEYQSSQKIGILTCGHLFHKDCIYPWLDRQKTCPLCRQANVIVTKQERVP